MFGASDHVRAYYQRLLAGARGGIPYEPDPDEPLDRVSDRVWQPTPRPPRQCVVCHTVIPVWAHPKRITCSSVCATRRSRERQTERQQVYQGVAG